MEFQETVREISNGKFFIAIQPPLTKEETEILQREILGYFKEIDEFALAGKIGQKRGISYFMISMPHPQPGFYLKRDKSKRGEDRFTKGMPKGSLIRWSSPLFFLELIKGVFYSILKGLG